MLFKFLAWILICQTFENWLREMWERCSCVRSTAKAGDSGDTIRKTQIDYRLPNHSELIPVLTLNEFTTLLHFKLLPSDTSPILDLAFHRLCHFGFTISDTVPELWIISSVLVPIQTLDTLSLHFVYHRLHVLRQDLCWISTLDFEYHSPQNLDFSSSDHWQVPRFPFSEYL